MGKNKQFRDMPNTAPVLVKRVNWLMEKNHTTQSELANACGISSTTVSACFGKDKEKGWRDPRIKDLQAIAKYFGVSIDYLLGENECEIPDNEQIHRKTGLSGNSIEVLQEMNIIRDEDIVISKKLAVINYLLESAPDSTLLENLYNYLLGRFSFPGKEEAQGAAYMLESLPNGREGRNLTFKDVFSQACFVLVQEDLTRLKDSIRKQRDAEEKATYQAQAGKETP